MEELLKKYFILYAGVLMLSFFEYAIPFFLTIMARE